MQKFVAVFETLRAFFFFFKKKKGFLTSESFPAVLRTARLRHAVLIKVLTFEPSFLRPAAVIIPGSDWLALIQISIQICEQLPAALISRINSDP